MRTELQEDLNSGNANTRNTVPKNVKKMLKNMRSQLASDIGEGLGNDSSDIPQE